jgi:hypothetical protein
MRFSVPLATDLAKTTPVHNNVITFHHNVITFSRIVEEMGLLVNQQCDEPLILAVSRSHKGLSCPDWPIL